MGYGSLERSSNGAILNTDSSSAHAALKSRQHIETQEERINRLEAALEKLLAQGADHEPK